MKKRLLIWFIVAFVAITIQVGFFSHYADFPQKATTLSISAVKLPETPSSSISTFVARVVDGDTIVANIHGASEKVRLIGVDTPETVDPRKPVQCFGKEASDFTTTILLNKQIILESDSTQSNRDKYGRLLRYVFLSDGTLVNKLLITEGYGYEYTYDAPYKYQREFKQAQATAKELKKGLWKDGVCP